MSREHDIVYLLNRDLTDAIVKLINAEAKVRKLEGIIETLLEYVDNESDVIDGPYGPEANGALSLASSIRAELDWSGTISIDDLK